ncbi:MAG: NHL repeat-containing protein [Chloroflexi bacterium]|nr:NHL repeat-containing protein [Chloroflexota bacterium]MDA8187081.1 NHL repeat-containing protein [Dehalococcoidales bacterium]
MRILRDKRAALLLLIIFLGVLGGVTYLTVGRNLTGAPTEEVTTPWQEKTPKPGEERQVSELEVPAKLVMHVEAAEATGSPQENASGGASSRVSLNQPSDMVSIGDRLFVLDSGNGRLVELDRSGKVVRILDGTVDERLALHLPMAMTAHGDSLYVADSGSGRVLVVNVAGGEAKVEKVISLDRLQGDKDTPRPIGIAVNADGDIFVSDANNQRVLKCKADGTVASFVGTGKREAGNYGLNAPGSIALDGQGNIYVVDILNGRVMKYSPDGKFLLQIGQLGDTVGKFSRPKGVAIDGQGNIFVSDSLQAAVQVFDPQGKYIGLIGRKEPGNKDSGSIFRAPAELKIVDRLLYVTDRLSGPFIFELQG